MRRNESLYKLKNNNNNNNNNKYNGGGIILEFFSTRDVHPRDKKEYWMSVASSVFFELDCTPRDKAVFNADMKLTELSDLRFITINTDECVVVRSADIIKRAQSDELILCIQLSGSVRIEQGHTVACLRPGDCCLYDSSRPHRIEVPEKAGLLTVKMGRQNLERRLGRLERFTGRLLRRESSVASIMTGFWRLLPERVESIDGHAASRIAFQALDLLATALEEGSAENQQSSTCRALTILRVKDIIEIHLGNPDLTCADIAAKAGISRRYLSHLFEAEGISLQAYIKRRRLEKCREAFESRHQVSRSISDISFGWGFKDAGNFSRSFKECFSEPPRHYRKRRLYLSPEMAG